MRIDAKLAIASFISLGIGFAAIFMDLTYHLSLGIIPGIFMLGYVFLFTLFLYYNHEIAKTESPTDKSIGEYKFGTKIWAIMLLIGVICAFIGFIIGLGVLIGCGITIAGIALCPLTYCIVGWDDIKRKSKN